MSRFTLRALGKVTLLPTQPPMVLGLTEEEDVFDEVGVDLSPSRGKVPE